MSAATPDVQEFEATGRVTFPRILASEWTKFRSVRSTLWCLGVGIFLTIGVPLFAAAVVASDDMSSSDHSSGEALDIALAGVYIAQLVIAVLGVLVISAEYSTGSIRSTFTAVPKRLPVLWAKLIDYAVATLAVMLPAVLISFFATQAILSGRPDLHASLTDSGVARSVLMSAVFVSLVGVFALALGAITRNTAAGIALFAAIFFVLPPLLLTLPVSWQDAIGPYVPAAAGFSMFQLHHESGTLTPLGGGPVFAAWCAVAIAIAAVLVRRRDV